jgi:hypothetical protein
VRTEDFESLAANAERLAGELALHGNTFRSNYHQLRVYRPSSHPVDQVCLGDPPEGYAPRTGTCIGTGLVDLETLEIIVGTPAIRAGRQSASRRSGLRTSPTTAASSPSTI